MNYIKQTLKFEIKLPIEEIDPSDYLDLYQNDVRVVNKAKPNNIYEEILESQNPSDDYFVYYDEYNPFIPDSDWNPSDPEPEGYWVRPSSIITNYYRNYILGVDYRQPAGYDYYYYYALDSLNNQSEKISEWYSSVCLECKKPKKLKFKKYNGSSLTLQIDV